MDSNKQKALSAALAQIDRQFGKGTVMRLGDKERVTIPSISKGSLGLEWVRSGAVFGNPLSTIDFQAANDGLYSSHVTSAA